MTKILTLVALFGVMSIGLVGCGSGEETVTEGDAANAVGTANSKSGEQPAAGAGREAAGAGGTPATMDPPK